jgi:hypothetical protein
VNFDQASKLPSSEKITLMTVEAVERVKIFTDEGSGIYSRSVSFFIESMKNSGVNLSKVNSTPANDNEFYFNETEKKVYVKLATNPRLNDLSITYKLFFSTAPIILPFDLNNGSLVEWEARLETIGSIGQQLDEDNIGIVLESQSTATLINSDGYFDEIFDTLIWENQSVKFYSWISGISITEAKKIFDGVVESKDFGQDKITLKVRDFVFRLQNQVNLPLFSELDGDVSPSLIGKPKRRIYGRVDQVKCAGLDNVLDGYPLTGTLNGAITGTVLTGTGTQFLKELSPEDEIYLFINNEEIKLGIQSVDSDTQITLSDELEQNIVNITAIVLPKVPYRFKNREWSIAGHKLRTPIATITEIKNNNRFIVDSTEDFEALIQCDVNDELVTIRRISENEIVFQNALSPIPLVGDTITRLPVNNVFFGSRELIFDRDWTIQNTTEAKIVFNALAEFNSTEQRALSTSFVFTNGSRTITTSAQVDLRSILKSRDWIRKNNISQTEWYEILEVKEQSIILRTPVIGSLTSSVYVKTIEYINDDSLITANCLGLEVDNKWVKRPAEAVRHLVLNDAGFAQVNEDKFLEAKNDCDYTLSLVIPDSLGSDSPKIKDVINNINESVFGSLYGDSAFNISYSILNAEKPELTEILRDDDILSWESSSSQKIVNKVKVNYRPFVDRFNGEDAVKTIEFNSGFVDKLIGINNTLERTLYLYEDDKAEIIAQRLALFNSLSSTVITVKAKLNLALKTVGDKMFLSLDRLYKRYGGRDRRKIGTITGIKKNGYDTDVTFVDLANVYNRVPAIAPNDTQDYSAGIEDDIVRWGYVLDNDTESPDSTSELQLGNNLIG